jgi:hypothetical protein
VERNKQISLFSLAYFGRLLPPTTAGDILNFVSSTADVQLVEVRLDIVDGPRLYHLAPTVAIVFTILYTIRQTEQ